DLHATPEETDEELLEALQAIWDHELEVRKPHDFQWARTWDRFWNRWGFERKKDWQSKRGLPVLTIMALKYAWEMTKVLELAGTKWAEATTDDDTWRDLIDLPRDLVLRYMQTDGSDPDNDFLQVYYNAMVGM